MSLTTRAAVVESGGAPFTLSDVELDEPGAHEAVVRMVATGLCHTDLGVASGGLPFPLPGVLGHEGAGVVEAVGSAVTEIGKHTSELQSPVHLVCRLLLEKKNKKSSNAM